MKFEFLIDDPAKSLLSLSVNYASELKIYQIGVPAILV